MDAKEGRKLIDGFAKLIGDMVGTPMTVKIDRPAEPQGKTPLPQAKRPDMPSEPNAGSFDDPAIERMYHAFKNRLIDDARIDPILLQLLTTRPELVVEVEPRIVTLDAATLKGRVARLLAAGWFTNGARATSAVRKELARTGSDPGGGGTLGTVLGDYVKDGFLVREGEMYALAPGVKITEKELKVV